MQEKTKHVQLNESDLSKAIQETPTFKTFPKFKQSLTLKHQNIKRLYDYYGQACRLSIEYLRQNPNIFSNDVKIIEEIIKN